MKSGVAVAAARSLGMAVLIVVLFAGCVTPSIDWSTRIGHYTYDQAVVELGPPDKQERLKSGVLVAEWVTRQGYVVASGPYGWGYPWWGSPYGCGWPYGSYYGAPYPGYFTTYYSPAQWLRLVFSPDGELTGWREFTK
jgi:hypothetical protein